MMKIIALPVLITVLALIVVNQIVFASHTLLPAGFTETRLASGLSGLSVLTIAPDGRVFVAQQQGIVRVLKHDRLLSAPFISLSHVNYEGEHGLLGIEVDPDFATNHYVYLYATMNSPTLHNRLMRVVANGNVADMSTLTVLADLPDVGSALWHMGGAIHFGRDGKLYLAVGDHRSLTKAFSIKSPFGKLLRFNPDGTIPTDNPYYLYTDGINRAIWARGLRNPYTFAIQPGTGRLFINDVGRNAWEEINIGVYGGHYGWPAAEGYEEDLRFINPIYTYQHDGNAEHGGTYTTGCAISGGTFYNPVVVNFPPEYVGKYFFMDYCNSWINVLDPADKRVTNFASDLNWPTDLRTSPDGSIYYLARGDLDGTNGQVYKIRYEGNN